MYSALSPDFLTPLWVYMDVHSLVVSGNKIWLNEEVSLNIHEEINVQLYGTSMLTIHDFISLSHDNT